MADGVNNLMEVGLIEGAGKVLPDLYKDAAHPVAEQTGILFARIPRAINAALSPIDIWIAKKEYNIERTKKLLEIELQNVDPEKIVSPEPYVAVPAFQAISYSIGSEELSSIYAKLLAKSMNTDYKDSVHPAFVEIIKQMSPLDARVFSTLMKEPVRPMLSYMIFTVSGEDRNNNVYFLKHVTFMDFASIDEICISLDNLSRLKLIGFNGVIHYAYDHLYEKLEQLVLTSIEDRLNKVKNNLGTGKICISAHVNTLPP